MQGIDVTDEFMKGAYEALRIAEAVGAKEALFIEKSPSCGCGLIFDGSFKDKFKAGDGVTAALLKKNGIKVTCIKVEKRDSYQFRSTIIVLVFIMPSTRRIFSMHSLTSTTFMPLITATMSYSPVTS